MRPYRFPLVILALSSCLSAAGLPAYAVRVEQVPTPRPAGWTVDLTGTLPAGTVQELDQLGDRLHREAGAELAVVVVGSVEGRDPHAFALELFNRWGIGDARENNGVLVFAALDDRKAEIVLGSGVDGSREQAASQAIMRGVMVPRFRAGDTSGAISLGAQACAERILGLRIAGSGSSGEERAEEPGAAAAVPGPSAGHPPAEAPPGAAPAAKAVPARPPASSRSPASRDRSPWLLAGAAVALLGFVARAGFRYRSRSCPDCGTRMVRLDEAADDAHLSAGERVEEGVGSVDYDVWACRSCARTLKLRYGALLTRYALCPGCGAKTKSRAKTTLRAASYTEGGLVEVKERCAACDYSSVSTYATPVLERPSSSDDDSRSSSSHSSGFGGGHSSGRGASGGW